MTKVLVVGATGTIGSALMNAAGRKHDVLGTYRTKERSGLVKLDVTDVSAVEALLDEFNPELILDAHANSMIDKCENEKDEAWEINVHGTRNLLRAAKRKSAKIIFISTDQVYDGNQPIHFEDGTTNPLHHYGKTKVAAEIAAHKSGADFLALRSSFVYSDGNTIPGLLQKVLNSLNQGKDYVAFHDQFRKPMMLNDFADAVLELYERNASGILNFGGPDYLSMYDFCARAAEVFGYERTAVKFASSSTQMVPRPKELNISTERLYEVLGRKLIGVDEGLRRVRKQMEAPLP